MQIAKLNLSPADQLLARGLVDMLNQELAKRVGAGLLDEKQRIIVADLMNWVLEAAEMA